MKRRRSLLPRQTWIPDRCRQFGLVVVEVDGWRTRGSESFNPAGVVAHHTAGPSTGDMPSLNVLVNGRPGIPGPLANVGLGRSGKVYVVAAGRANHAGQGGWRGLAGNSSVLGVEAENVGTAADPWPPTQLDAYYRLCAALISGTTLSDVRNVCGHKEWAPGRKIDPHTLDMGVFRGRVADILSGEDDVSEKDVKEALDKYGLSADGTNLLGRLDRDTDVLIGLDKRLDDLEAKVEDIRQAVTGGGSGGAGPSLAQIKEAVRQVLTEGTGGTP